MTARLASLAWAPPLLALAGCGGGPDAGSNISGASDTTSTVAEAIPPAPDMSGTIPATPAPLANPATAAAPSGRISCAADIGAAAAEKRAKLCRNVSPATRPPCNVANSCAMIEDEIARSCALFDGKGDPMAGCTPAPKSSQAAAAVVQRYYSALNARDFSTAWQQWGNDGPPNQTMTKFEAGFARTRSTQVKIGALQPSEGGAGSIYQTVPVTVDATLDDGAHQRFVGTYVVRRVNGVDGASADQQRWHIDSAKLKPAAR